MQPIQPTAPQSTGMVNNGAPLSPQQLQAYKSDMQSKGIGSVSQTSSPTASPSAPATLDWVNSLGKGSQPKTTQGGSMLDTYKQGVLNASQAGVNQVKSGFGGAYNDLGQGNPLKAVEDVGSGLAGVVNTAMAPAAPLMSPISSAVNAVADKVSDIPAVQKFAQSPAGQTTSRVAQDVSNADTIASAVTGVKGAPEIANETGNLAQKAGDVASAVKEKINGTPEEQATAKAQSDNVQLQKVADDWQKPTTVNKPAFNNARGALAKDPATPKFLAEQGLNPYTHIEDGKYTTSDTAQALRDTASKMSNETLRPSLQMADYTTPKTSVTDIQKAAIKNLEKSTDMTPADVKTGINNINKEASALTKKYPQGMGLTDMHDNKITYTQNAGFKPFSSASDSIKANANRSMGAALQKAVETNAPKDIPVSDFNSYLSKYYKGADYLDSLNGKTAPLTLGQKIARPVSKFAGAAIGGHFGGGIVSKFAGAAIGGHFGGGIVSEFAGYQIGKALEHAVENMTNPMRDTFLRNLKTTNPEAFSKVSNFIGKQEAENATRLALPAGTKLGEKGNPIVTPPPKDASGVKLVNAKKVAPTANPKTGRMQKVFTSEAE